MIRAALLWFICALLACCLACNRSDGPPTLPPKPTALTLEAWRQLPAHEKYDGAALQQLRMHDEQLMKSSRAWKKFMNEVVMPEMKKDIPPPSPN